VPAILIAGALSPMTPVALAATAPESLLVATPQPPPTVPGVLTLDEALRLAAHFNPGLAETAWRVEAAANHVRDVSRMINPTLEGTVENFGGGVGTGRMETTISANQTFPLGGVRGARTAVATGERMLAEADLSDRQRAVIAETGEAFVEAWWLQERVQHLRRFEQIAAATVATARERTRIGAAPPLEGLRAQSVEATRAVERRTAESELREARARLALQWGDSGAAIDSLVLPASTIPDLPPPDSLLSDLERNPERLRAAAETAIETARLREARAQRAPGLSLHGGVRHFNELNSYGFVAGASIDLPIWNTGGAGVQSAEAAQRAASFREHSQRLQLERELRSSWERLMSARDRSHDARTRALPTARQALAELERGYRSGRFSFLDHLDGQRAAVEAEMLVIETERDLWTARFELERLLGRSLEEVGR